MFAAERIAEAEQRGSVDREREEDEQDHGRAQSDLAVLMARAGGTPIVFVGIVEQVIHVPVLVGD